jgi:hypothetical protein
VYKEKTMNIEEKYEDFLVQTERLCAAARFELMLCLFEQFDTVIDRSSAIAGLQAYLNAEQADMDRERRYAH